MAAQRAPRAGGPCRASWGAKSISRTFCARLGMRGARAAPGTRPALRQPAALRQRAAHARRGPGGSGAGAAHAHTGRAPRAERAPPERSGGWRCRTRGPEGRPAARWSGPGQRAAAPRGPGPLVRACGPRLRSRERVDGVGAPGPAGRDSGGRAAPLGLCSAAPPPSEPGPRHVARSLSAPPRRALPRPFQGGPLSLSPEPWRVVAVAVARTTGWHEAARAGAFPGLWSRGGRGAPLSWDQQRGPCGGHEEGPAAEGRVTVVPWWEGPQGARGSGGGERAAG